METENGFRITTYKKKDLACLYCPNATARCAIRTLTRWIKRNNELDNYGLNVAFSMNNGIINDSNETVFSEILKI